jgi:hypothetical protein
LAESAIIAANALSYWLFNSGEGSWAKDDRKKTERERKIIDSGRSAALVKPLMPSSPQVSPCDDN